MTDEQKIRMVEASLDGIRILSCSEDISSQYCNQSSGRLFKRVTHLVMPCEYHVHCYDHLEEMKGEK